MRFDHLAIPVSDVHSVMSWFKEIYPDTEILYADDEWCFLLVGETKLAFVQENLHPSHFALVVSPSELQKLSEKYDQEIEQPREDMLSFYVTGPEGVCIEFVSYLKDFNDG